MEAKKMPPLADAAQHNEALLSNYTADQEIKTLLTAYKCCFLRDDNPKRPAGDKWQLNPRKPSEWNGQGIGIICGSIADDVAVHALDCDTLHPGLASAMERIISELLECRPGRKLKRIGLPPKFLVPFKMKQQQGKRSTPAYYPADDDKCKNQLEVLGTGNQFVAYNIHPDTGQPYQWYSLDGKPGANLFDVAPGELVELTEDDLAGLMAKFNEEAQKLGLKEKERDKKARQAPVKPRKVRSSDAGIIDLVVDAYVLADVLAAKGYQEKGRDRFLGLNSSTGEPGIVILTGEDGRERAYSHHSDDPLSDGHAHDVFDVLCLFDFGGDVSKAIAHFANELDPDGQKKRRIEYEATKNAVTPEAFEAIVQKAATKPAKVSTAFALPDYPPELLALPGGLGEVQKFIYNRMAYPSIATAGITALATVAAFAQTHITVDSRDGLGLNEQFMILAATGFGKEDLRKPIEILDRESDRATIGKGLSGELMAAQNVKLMYAAPSSQQGLHKILEDNRSVYFLSDEFAEWLRMSHSDSHKQAALGYLMQIYTKALGTVEPGHAVTRSYERVTNPRVGILATSTAEALLETMTREQADSGAYNRWVMFVGDQELPKKRYTGLVYKPEQSVVEFIAWIKTLGEKHLRFSPAAFQEFIHLDDTLAEPIKRKDGVLGGRLSEQAIKMAALFALSDRRQAIEPQDLKLAFTIRIGLYHRAAALAQHEGSLSGMHQTGEAMEQIHQLLKNNQMLYKTALPTRSRKYNKLSIPERNAVINALFEHGIAAPVKDNPKVIVSCVYEE
ncbi:MAG: bifunctional DNA primase/polymerase [Alishewanella agri]|nr:bifunctional DNA primase/polymerase [Alishewanella agri]